MKFNHTTSKGFSLIELMIVIAIIGILVAVALPQFAAMTEDAKKTKAKQDCDTIAQAVQKFNSLEGSTVANLMDLKGKYLTNIDTLKDPWGNAYTMNASKGLVYSKGANGKDDIATGKNGDDIFVNYIGALTIVDAKLEVNPEGGNASATGDADEQKKVYDVLHLYFNKAVTVPATLDISATNAVDNMNGITATQDPGAKPGNKAFRYFEGGANKITTAPSGLPSGLVQKWPSAVRESTSTGSISYGADSKEIVIRFPDGKSGILIPGTHYINLTGAKNTKNPSLFEIADPANAFGGTGTIGAEASGTPILIKNMD